MAAAEKKKEAEIEAAEVASSAAAKAQAAKVSWEAAKAAEH